MTETQEALDEKGLEAAAKALAGSEWSGVNDRPRFRRDAEDAIRAYLAATRAGEGGVTDEMIRAANNAFDDGVGDPNDYNRRMGKALKAAFALASPVTAETPQPAPHDDLVAHAPPRIWIDRDGLWTSSEWLGTDQRDGYGAFPEYVRADIHCQAIAALSAVPRVPEGWQLVPVEPTEEMLSIGAGGAYGLKRGIWVAMLSAAPKQEG